MTEMTDGGNRRDDLNDDAMHDDVDCVVIGAGVVGLAVARALARSPRFAGGEVMVLDAANGIGTGTSSRNSEVIHAGIYYPPGSLKAQLCVQGKAMLYDYCQTRGIAHRRCGKLIVATSQAQVAELQKIMAKAAANGVHDLVLLSREEAQAMEPQLSCVAAVHSPSTGIIDSHAFMLALQGDLENAGSMVVLNTTVTYIKYSYDAIKIVTNDGTIVHTKTLVNAAGLYAPSLAQGIVGLQQSHVPNAHYCKGNYFTLAAKSPFNRLIYPVPEAAGLGVHLTLDLGGQAKFGPDVEWLNAVNKDSNAHISAADYVVDASRGDAFYAQIRKYWPALQDGALQAGYAGIRPKINAAHETAADFVIQGEETHGLAGLVNLFGIESPGLTSALAIGEYVDSLLRNR